MASKKLYGDAKQYESKLGRVMTRLGIKTFDYNWDRFGSWISFPYKGEFYRFSHSVKNAHEHGISLQYGSDAFAQLVLSLEDLARMAERGIYDLGVWISGMKYLPEGESLEQCFVALGFETRPATADEIKSQYHRLSKVMHPDAGGSETAFQALQNNYNQCLKIIESSGDAS